MPAHTALQIRHVAEVLSCWTGVAPGRSAAMQPFLPMLSGRPGSAPTSTQTHSGLQTSNLAGVSAMSASPALASQPPALLPTALHLSSLADVPVSHAQPMQSPVPVLTAQQTDQATPQATSSQLLQAQLACAAPVLPSAVPGQDVRAAPALSQAAAQLPHSTAALPVPASEPGSSAAADRQLPAGAERASSVGGSDANGASEAQAQHMSRISPIAESSSGPAAMQEAPAASVQPGSISRKEETGKELEAIGMNTLSNGDTRAKEPPSDGTVKQVAPGLLQDIAEDSRAAAQQQAGAVSSRPQIYATAAHMEESKQQNSQSQANPAHVSSSAVTPPASAAPGQAPAEQLTVPAAQMAQPAAQANLAGQPGQAAVSFPPDLGSARREQLPISAHTVQRPGSLTKASPLPTLASAVTQQWLGSSPASAVRPAPKQGERFLSSFLQVCVLWQTALSPLQPPISCWKAVHVCMSATGSSCVCSPCHPIHKSNRMTAEEELIHVARSQAKLRDRPGPP